MPTFLLSGEGRMSRADLVGKDVVWVRRLRTGEDGRVTPQWSQVTMTHWVEGEENLSYVVNVDGESRILDGSCHKDFPHNFVPSRRMTSKDIGSFEDSPDHWLPHLPDRGKVYPFLIWGTRNGFVNALHAFPALEFSAKPESCWSGTAGEMAVMRNHRIRKLHDLYVPVKVVGETLEQDGLILDTIRLKGLEDMEQHLLTALWWASNPGGLACEILKPYAQRDEVLRNAWDGLDWGGFGGDLAPLMKLLSHPAYHFGDFLLERRCDKITAYSSVTDYNHPVQSSHDIFSLFLDHFAVTALGRSLDLKIWL